jgi:uncharacterized membrane protein
MAGCKVFDSNFNVVRVLASVRICLATPDGGFISANYNKKQNITRVGPDGSIIWQTEGYYHHQIKQLNSNYIIALYSEIKKINSDLVKFDGVRKINYTTGKIEKEFSLYKTFYITKTKNEWINDYYATSAFYRISFIDEFHYEYSHLNAISVQKNMITVSSSGSLTFKVDFDLNFISFISTNEYIPLLNAKNEPISSELLLKHDFHYLADDSILFFKNSNTSGKEKNLTYKIFEFKPDGRVFEFPKNEADFELSPHSGGVEKIGSNYLLGFPVADGQNSVVGLVSGDGHWLIKKNNSV